MLFESHITVEPHRRLEDWKLFCKTNEVKPLFIQLAHGKYPRQMMCSDRFDRPGYGHAFEKADRLADAIHKAGFRRVRVKLECPLGDAYTHPVAQRSYAECHGKLWLTSAEAERLVVIAQELPMYVSRNVIAPRRREKSKWYVTSRHYGKTPRHATIAFMEMEQRLAQHFPEYELEREWVLYDSDPHIDDGWVPNPRSA